MVTPFKFIESFPLNPVSIVYVEALRHAIPSERELE